MTYRIVDFLRNVNGYQLVEVIKDSKQMVMVDDGQKNNFFDTGKEAVAYCMSLKRG